MRRSWASPCRIDPFSIPVDQNLDLLLRRRCRTAPRPGRHPGRSFDGTSSASGRCSPPRSAAVIDQTRTTSGAGFAALSYKDGEIQKRSYPNSFGGQYQLKGYELVDELRLLENAPRIAEEAVALHSADQCPEGEFDLILDSSQLGLQIHESIGHPIELDRVLGREANYAGMSFLTLDKLGKLRYGSDIVNVVAMRGWSTARAWAPSPSTTKACRRSAPTSSATGCFTGYHDLARDRRRGRRSALERQHARRRLGAHAAHPHDQRQPAAGRAVARRGLRRDHGIYMETNRSWSIDDKRYNFQFGCEIGWEIRAASAGAC